MRARSPAEARHRAAPVARRVVPALVVCLLVVAGLAVAVIAAMRTPAGAHARNAAPTASHSSNAPASTKGQPAPTPSPTVSPLWQRTIASAAALLPSDAAARVPLPLAASTSLTSRVQQLVADPAFAHDSVAVVLADPATGRLLLNKQGTDAVAPASTAKLAVAAAALHELGPASRFTTKVVAGSDGQIVLIGGGDPTLAGPQAVGAFDPGFPQPARLTDLAAATAHALSSNGRTSVRLGYDVSLFSGAPLGPAWKPTYLSEGDVAPVVALEVDEGQITLGKEPRSSDPALLAAQDFASLLRGDGVAVEGTPTATKASAGAAVLAGVQSPPISALVQRMLDRSDNDLAEALARHLALHDGLPPTFAGAAAAVRAGVSQLGVDTTGFAMDDASGLSPADRLPPVALARLLDLAASRPDLTPIVDGLPVAGFSGTLASRYTTAPASSVAGHVRAKTGTLDGVVALAGYRDEPRGSLVFVVVVTGVSNTATVSTERAVDRLVAALSAA